MFHAPLHTKRPTKVCPHKLQVWKVRSHKQVNLMVIKEKKLKVWVQGVQVRHEFPKAATWPVCLPRLHHSLWNAPWKLNGAFRNTGRLHMPGRVAAIRAIINSKPREQASRASVLFMVLLWRPQYGPNLHAHWNIIKAVIAMQRQQLSSPVPFCSWWCSRSPSHNGLVVRKSHQQQHQRNNNRKARQHTSQKGK